MGLSSLPLLFLFPEDDHSTRLLYPILHIDTTSAMQQMRNHPPVGSALSLEDGIATERWQWH